VEQDARALGLTFYIVADAGRTQVEAGSLTVIAVGPGNLMLRLNDSLNN